MITTAEYLREKARADVAEARIVELEGKIASLEGSLMRYENQTEPPQNDLDTNL